MEKATLIIEEVEQEVGVVVAEVVEKSMYVLELNMVQTLALSVIVLLFGKLLVEKIGVLNKFCIPAPVVGGLIFSLLTLLGHATGIFGVELETSLRTLFMTAFFTTVGFGASWSILKKGGIAVVIFLGCAVVLVIMQNAVGVTIAKLFGENPFIGIIAGSISMTGGHGTAGAFCPTIAEKFGYTAAPTIGMAAATFGLIAGSLIGGPTGRKLIEKKHLSPGMDSHGEVVAAECVHDHDNVILESPNMSNAFFQISIAMGFGSIISILIDMTGLTVPPYIGAMLAAAAMRNIFADGSKFQMRMPEINALGDIFLGIFLSQALMGLKLWELADLALPLTTILLAQTLMMYLYATYVTFNVMGRDYDAAVLAGGHCGFGLGATPNAIANMNAIVSKYGPSPKAFFVLPLVGCLFIDFINATIITLWMHFIGG